MEAVTEALLTGEQGWRELRRRGSGGKRPDACDGEAGGEPEPLAFEVFATELDAAGTGPDVDPQRVRAFEQSREDRAEGAGVAFGGGGGTRQGDADVGGVALQPVALAERALDRLPAGGCPCSEQTIEPGPGLDGWGGRLRLHPVGGDNKART